MMSGVVLFFEASIVHNELVNYQMVPRFIPKNDTIKTNFSKKKQISTQKFKHAATSHQVSSSNLSVVKRFGFPEKLRWINKNPPHRAAFLPLGNPKGKNPRSSQLLFQLLTTT